MVTFHSIEGNKGSSQLRTSIVYTNKHYSYLNCDNYKNEQ